MREYTEKLLEKLRESTAAVLPIAGIVLVLCFALVPVPSGILLCFLAGAVLLTVGLRFFNLGAEMAMSPKALGRSGASFPPRGDHHSLGAGSSGSGGVGALGAK